VPVIDGVIKPLRRGGSTPEHVEHWFGAHCDGDNLVTVSAPILGSVTFHKRVAAALVGVLEDIEGAGMAHLIDRADYGGTYCCRMVRGGNQWSPHSWGIAIDLNVHHIVRGGVERRDSATNFQCTAAQIAPSLRTLAAFFNARGFSWGGHWKCYFDPMHFEATEITIQKLAAGGAAPPVLQRKPLLVQRADSNEACEMWLEKDRAVALVREVASLCGYEVVDHLKDLRKVILVQR